MGRTAEGDGDCSPGAGRRVIIAFQVEGDPKPKGSKTTGVTKNGVRYVRESNKGTKPWVELVKFEAKRVMGHGEKKARPPFNGPVKVTMHFYLKRPKRHFRTNGELHWWAPFWVENMPDLDKLERSILDGIYPWIVKNDSQVCAIQSTKTYCRVGQRPHVSIDVRELA